MEFTYETVAFFIFALTTLGSGIMVVTDENLFHASLYLLFSLFGVSGLFVLLVAPFLAAVQVLVYMGAIGILIIFAIMLTRGMMKMDQVYNSQRVAAAVVAVLLFIALAVTLTPIVDELEFGEDLNAELAEDPVADVTYETVNELGKVITDRNGFVLPFEVASLLLTAAMIGAIVVAREDEA
ncbi:MAG: NADH-quinone oxidoreductase subunit J [Anaerolineae bacterium]|nr:MAG: NADH-quinone oxidoreductase subunit J [Anaerolineae bacterium]